MDGGTASSAETGARRRKGSVSHSTLGQFFWLSSRFWTGESATRAWLLSMLVLVCLVAQVGSQLGVNAWQRLFFDALEQKDAGRIGVALGWLPVLVFASALAVSAVVIARLLLQVRWREWVTDRLMGWWLADQRYYRLGFVAPDQAAPEYRIAEDLRLAIEPFVDFVTGLLSALVTAATFAAILWQVAGSWPLSIAGVSVIVPAYMAVAAGIYAALASVAIYFTGRPLVARIAAKNEAEARFRAELTRLRENAENIALVHGDAGELAGARQSYRRILDAWLGVVRHQGVLALALNSNGAFLPILPLLLATPKHLSGELTLGGVMQVVAAFLAVQGALMWFVDNFMRLAEWYASAERVSELTIAMRELDAGVIMEDGTPIRLEESSDGSIRIENLSIADRGGRLVVKDASILIVAGEKILVQAESAAAESIFVRSLAGFWPWGSGVVRMPKDVAVSFMPERPYLPLGTLRTALTYPGPVKDMSDEQLVDVMSRCGLGHLANRLDEDGVRWDQALSSGDLQRLTICRLLLQRPGIVLLDNVASALDRGSAGLLQSILRTELEASTIVSVAHGAPGGAYDRTISLEKRQAAADLSPNAAPRQLPWPMRSAPGKQQR
jgi:putative ATP-binding cassette transporter